MKKLFPEAPDVSQSVANRAVKIVERHFRAHRVSRACDLPEEAKIRLYRDLRFFFEGGSGSPSHGSQGRASSIRGFFSRLCEKIEDFLSASEPVRGIEPGSLLFWVVFGQSGRAMIITPRFSG